MTLTITLKNIKFKSSNNYKIKGLVGIFLEKQNPIGLLIKDIKFLRGIYTSL